MGMPVCFLSRMKNKVFIITGPRGSGKTTFLKHLVQELRQFGIQSGGFLAEGFCANNERYYFELIDLDSNKRILFCTKELHIHWEKLGHFYINPASIIFGEKVLDTSNLDAFPICVIDEVGPFELQGKGWSQAIFKIGNNSPEKPMIWVVRENLVQPVIRHFDLNNYSLKLTNQDQIKNLTIEILDFLGSGNPAKV
jgi:nucleoside-triphosphatase THEP1